MHYWFKSYGDFAEWVDFDYWWIFSGGGSAVHRATLSSFNRSCVAGAVLHTALLLDQIGYLCLYVCPKFQISSEPDITRFHCLLRSSELLKLLFGSALAAEAI